MEGVAFFERGSFSGEARFGVNTVYALFRFKIFTIPVNIIFLFAKKYAGPFRLAVTRVFTSTLAGYREKGEILSV